MARAPLLPLLALSLLGLGACAAGASAPGAPPMAAEAAPAPPPPVLDHSLFARDFTGQVGEADLQKLLASDLDLNFPARLGVVALAQPFRAEAGAGVGEQGSVSAHLTRALTGSPYFSLVTDVSTALPNPQGIEGLRTVAARYRTRYLLLTSVTTEDVTHLNNWAWLYATGVGLLLAPGQTVGSQGLMQVSLMDVKTGTLLFTVVEPFATSRETWLVGGERAHRAADARAVAAATRRVAGHVLARTGELVRSYDAERAERVASAPTAIPPAPAGDVAAPPPAASAAPAPAPEAAAAPPPS